MYQIAIMGFGTIGSGVYDIVAANADILKQKSGQEIGIRRILDLREFPGHPAEQLLTHSFEDILNDPEISLVVETMGGVEPAFTFEKQLLLAGRHVVTSNKELVEKKGAELFEAARAGGAHFYYEASVGGGIPIIRNLSDCIVADRIDEISGILNGTTNYILTQMTSGGVSYEEALVSALALGYAEKDPTADVEGLDAGRKIAILASMVLGEAVHLEDVTTEGITGLTSTDFSYARELNMSIKLVADARFEDGGVRAIVAPAMVPVSNALYEVSDVLNAVTVHGDMVDTLMFYGRGAGSHATASAVLADVVCAARGVSPACHGGWSGVHARILDPLEAVHANFIRVSGSIDGVYELIRIFGGGSPVSAKKKEEFGFVTPVMSEAEFREKTAQLDGFIKRIRVK
ncbi:MAG: homoserine dehydrogenase [Lachnospiraceae bacterium]|nr:homoserine dehydrogenase [Lachnospiraceae bacterium]